MKVEPNTLFEMIDPPAGGENAMRARLRETHTPRTRRFLLPAAALAGLAAAAIWFVQTRNEAPPITVAEAELYDAAEFDRLLGRMPAPVDLHVSVNGRDANVVLLGRPDSKVRIYQIE
jgi:hypothetical protein